MMQANTPAGRAATVAGYDELAILSRSAAAAEPLENVRLKHMTSAASWDHLATVGRRIEELRRRQMTEKPTKAVPLHDTHACLTTAVEVPWT